MTRFDIHDDAVWQVTARHNGCAIGAIRIHQVNATRVQFENKKARDCGFCGSVFAPGISGSFGLMQNRGCRL
jgi:hypothetical protein